MEAKVKLQLWNWFLFSTINSSYVLCGL